MGQNSINSIARNYRKALGNKVNIGFLSPVILSVVTILVFMLLLPLLPVNAKIPLSVSAVFFWLICFLCFLVGTMFGAGGRFHISTRSNMKNARKVNNFLILIVVVGILGAALFSFERFQIRGVSFNADAMENRDALIQSTPSIISAIAAFCYSIGIWAYMAVWISELNHVKVRLPIKIAAALVAIVIVLVNLQIGSRSLLLVLTLSHLFGWFFVLKVRRTQVKRIHIAIAGIVVVLVACLCALLLVERVGLMGRSMVDSISSSAYAEIITPSEFILDSLQDESSLTEFSAGLFSLIQYVFHGIYEFNLLFNNFVGDYEIGRRTFWLPLKVVSLLTGDTTVNGDFNNSGINVGVFTTFVGPLFIDFGLFSPFVLFIYGLLIACPYRLLIKGKIEWLPAVTLVATSTVFWPMVNIFESSSGLFLFVGAISFGLLGKRVRGIS